jgi:hypothetical protein
MSTPTPDRPTADEQSPDQRQQGAPGSDKQEHQPGPDDPTPEEVDPMAPGRTIVDPDLDEAIEPNEPA